MVKALIASCTPKFAGIGLLHVSVVVTQHKASGTQQGSTTRHKLACTDNADD
jgi:hypothetical protein